MRIQRCSRQLHSGCKQLVVLRGNQEDPLLIPARSKALKIVPTVTPIGLVPHAGPIPWMNSTEGSLRLVDTAPGITTVNGRPFPSAGTTMTARAMDVAHHRVLGWRTTRLRAVPTRIPLMPGLRLLLLRRAPMMILI